MAGGVEPGDQAAGFPFGVQVAGEVAGAELVAGLPGGRARTCRLPCVYLGAGECEGPAVLGRQGLGWWSGVLPFADALKGMVLGRVAGGARLPAAPEDVDPGAGQDACGVRWSVPRARAAS